MFQPKALLLLLALSLTSLASNAAELVAMDDLNTADDAESYSFQNPYVPFGVINDWVSFSITAPRILTAGIDSGSTIGMQFNEFDLYAADRITLLASANFEMGSPVLNYAGFGNIATTTEYFIKISGPRDALGNYSGYINLVGLPPVITTPDPIAIAVPEPETYAMLLAGLGLMGFVASRRKS
ncbi:MAG: FxDxF family PEP-CTERM protein [Candidatus Methylopumilus sp.]|jgi:hypothetical protein